MSSYHSNNMMSLTTFSFMFEMDLFDQSGMCFAQKYTCLLNAFVCNSSIHHL